MKKELYVCDFCRKKIEETPYENGWISLVQIRFNISKDETGTLEGGDFCSPACLTDYIKTKVEERIEEKESEEALNEEMKDIKEV